MLIIVETPKRSLSRFSRMYSAVLVSTALLLAATTILISVTAIGHVSQSRHSSADSVQRSMANNNNETRFKQSLNAVEIVEPFVVALEAVDVELHQVQLLDYLNGEAEDANTSSSRIFGGSIKNGASFNLVRSWHVVQSFAHTLTRTPRYDRADFAEMARRTRALYIAHTILNNAPTTTLLFNQLAEASYNATALPKDKHQTIALKEYLQYIIDTQTHALFPWTNPPFESIQSMHESFKSSKDPIGIAITGGKKHFYLITHLILTLRKEFNITLPVQVFYSGQVDMPQHYAKKLQRMENVEAIDLTRFFPIETTQFSGWSCKPFAMLAASFQTVLFIDADSLFFQSPLRALESRAFKETGMVFFRDRKLRHKDLKGAELLNAAGKHLSSYALSIPFTNASDTTAESHVLDSGFIVLDKGNLGVLYSLLLAAKMNSQVERDTLYSYTWGDKEAYWFASEMLRVPYRLNPTFGSAIGYRKKSVVAAETNRECVCGAFLLQLDEHGDLFWWNGGGVLKDRYATPAAFEKEFVDDFHVVGLDLDGVGSEWGDFFPGGGCLRRQKENVRKLTDSEQALLQRYRDIYLHDIRDMSI
ncbi:hypothetical protein HDU77_010081 [Chytriomyces hyalinus]|nr:hypothetical protein HDU77_010081 [Chytriomyces hyalinus]